MEDDNPGTGRQNRPKSHAWTNTLLAICALLIAGYAVYRVRIEIQGARDSADIANCADHLRALSNALTQYASDHGSKYPPADRWVDCIDNDKYLPGIDRTQVFKCPLTKSYGYAMNSELGGKSLDDLGDIRNEVLLFETDNDVRNAHGSIQDLAKTRHRVLNVAYVDGQTGWVNPHTRDTWEWVPKPWSPPQYSGSRK